MKWTPWDVIGLLLAVVASTARGVVLWLGRVVGFVLAVFVIWNQIVVVFLWFKGYSPKQIFFGDHPHVSPEVEAQWKRRKKKRRRFFGRK